MVGKRELDNMNLKFSKVIDISMMVEPDIPVYKNRQEKKPEFINISNHLNDGVYETRVSINLHTGTHIDAPLHMIDSGETIDYYTPLPLLTACKVLDLTGVNDKITRQHLQAFLIEKDDFILLKTNNSTNPDFNTDFVFLAKDGAEYLVEKEIIGVGIDSLGIERDQPGHPTHKVILGNGMTLIEGLRLARVEAGKYILSLSPLKIKGVEAAPVRAVLYQN